VSFFPSLLLLPPPKPSILSSPTPRNHPLPPPLPPSNHAHAQSCALLCVCPFVPLGRCATLADPRRRCCGAEPTKPGGAPPKRGTLLVLTPPMTQWMEKNTTCACQQPTDWLKRAIVTVLFCAVWFFFIRCVFLTFYSAAAGNLVLSSTLSFLNIIISFALQKILLF
jgi:hypothetical protein